MQQPYRQMVLPDGTAMTCLDPPAARDTCPQPRVESDRRASRFVVGTLTVLAIGTAWVPAFLTLERFSRPAGRIDIAPEALERLRVQRRLATHAPRAPNATTARASTPPAPPSERAVMPWFDGHDHNPAKIVSGARTLQAMGVDVTLADVELPRSTIDCFDTFGYWPAIAFPSGASGGRMAALDLGDLPSDSPAVAAGLRKHDLLLTIDGYRIDDWARRDLDQIRGRGSMVLEIDRNGRRVLLSIHWRTKWKAA